MRFHKAKQQVLPLGPCSATGWGREVGKMPGRKEPRGAGQQQLSMIQKSVQVVKKLSGTWPVSAMVWPVGLGQ